MADRFGSLQGVLMFLTVEYLSPVPDDHVKCLLALCCSDAISVALSLNMNHKLAFIRIQLTIENGLQHIN